MREAGARTPGAALAALLALARPGDYFALLAYLHATPAVDPALQRVRAAAGGRSGLATTLGIGPRFLHSTGQLHKGGPTMASSCNWTRRQPRRGHPRQPFGFSVLKRAQARGDLGALRAHGCRVLRVDLGDDAAAGVKRLGTLAGALLQ